MHFNLCVIFCRSTNSPLPGWSGNDGAQKTNWLRWDPQTAFPLCKQGPAASQGDIPLYEGDHSWAPHGLFAIHFGCTRLPGPGYG